MMSSRERWVLYPLVVFSLAIGLAGQYRQLAGESRFRLLRCQQLVVESFDGQPVLVAHRLTGGESGLHLYNAAGERVASLRATPGGGQAALVRAVDGKELILGHEAQAQLSGLFAADLQRHGLIEPLYINGQAQPYLVLLDWPGDGQQPAEEGSGEEAASAAEGEPVGEDPAGEDEGRGANDE